MSYRDSEVDRLEREQTLAWLAAASAAERARRADYWRRRTDFDRDVRPDEPAGIAAGVVALARRRRLWRLALALAMLALAIVAALVVL